MKIAHVSSELCRRSAGLGKAVSEQSVVTRDLGFETKVYGISSAEWVEGDCLDWAGAEVEVFDPNSISGPFRYAPRYLNAIVGFDPDVIHLHGLWTFASLASLLAKKRLGCPLVVSAHGMLFPTSLSYNSIRKKMARVIFQDRVISASSMLHATSPSETESYRKLGFDNRIEEIPLGISIEHAREVGARESRRIVFLGRLHDQKGLDRLVRAWLEIEKNFPRWELQIAGPLDQSFSRTHQKLQSICKGRRAHFVGPKDPNEKWDFLSSADLFVLPSKSENFGLVVAESLLMEVPVIASKGTPWSKLGEFGAGWWIEAGSSQLASTMAEAMTLSEEERRLMGRRGRKWIKNSFSQESVARLWEKAYYSITKEKDSVR